MNRRLLYAMAVAAALAMAACGGATTTTEFTKADSDAIRGIVRDFVAAYNAKDVEKMATFFSANAALMPINRGTLHGIDAVKGYYRVRVTDEGGTDLAIEPIAVEGQGTIAYVAATFTMAFHPNDGSPERHDRGHVIWIARKYAGKWKFDWQMMSSDLPATPPAAPVAPASVKK